MVYKCLRGGDIKYYCHQCLEIIGTGWADKIYLKDDSNIICFAHTFYIICLGCGHYEIMCKDSFGYYFPKYTMIDMLEFKDRKI